MISLDGIINTARQPLIQSQLTKKVLFVVICMIQIIHRMYQELGLGQMNTKIQDLMIKYNNLLNILTIITHHKQNTIIYTSIINNNFFFFKSILE